jgi:hypothetical protein
MRFIAKKRFIDKNTKKLYPIGAEYKADSKERAEELTKKGFIDKKEESLLDQNVGEVKAAVTSEFSKEQLEELLQQEKDGDNRKGVIEYIESLLKGDEDESGKTE